MEKFIELLKPQNIFLEKKRLGPSEDGGYVVPKFVLENCSALFSYGVGYETKFDEDFYVEYQKPTYLFDHTIPHRAWDRQHMDIQLFNHGLGFGENCKDFHEDYNTLNIDGHVLLKIDIEGGEFDYFLNTSIPKMGDNVMGLLLEIHYINDPKNREDMVKMITKLNEVFVLCHIHGNNWGGEWYHNGETIPKVLELTFVNKKFVEKSELDDQNYPIPGLDVPNNRDLADYDLSFLKSNKLKSNLMTHYYQGVPSGWFNYEKIYQMALNHVKEKGQFVELGVWFGQSLTYAGVEIINSGKDIKLTGVDSFLIGDQPDPNSPDDPNRYSEALRFTEPVNSVVNIIKGDTHDVHSQFPDESIDFLFIDANHTYEDTMKDLELWYPKVKVGGLICGHDYEHPWPGLMKAVDEFFGVENFTVEHSCHTFVHHKPDNQLMAKARNPKEKILLAYLPIGPTYKDRVVSNLLKFDSYKYFDILLLTDDPEYEGFQKIAHLPNVIIDDVNKHREQFPEFLKYEILFDEKTSDSLYRKQVVEGRTKGEIFPMHLQRFVLNYENIDDYPYIMTADCDVTPIIPNDGEYESLMDYVQNIMRVNSVSSNRCYQEWQDRGDVKEFTKKWAQQLGKHFDPTSPIDTFDNPFKIMKFESPTIRKEFLNIWNMTLLDLFEHPETQVVFGSWNFSCEMLLAVLYKLGGIRVNKEDVHYTGVRHMKTFTYPEDRFWNDVSGRGLNVGCESKLEFIKTNEEELKKFYMDYGQDYPYEDFEKEVEVIPEIVDDRPIKKTVLTLTTIPTRLSYEGDLGLKSCIKSLVDQSYDDYEIHFNIPHINKRSGEQYVIPDWLMNYSDKIKIFRVEDMGPVTKLYHTVRRITDPDTTIIVVDDDLVYHTDLIKEQLKNREKWPESVVGYDGLRGRDGLFSDTRNYYFTSNYCTSRVDIIQHYKSASYKRRFFEGDFLSFVEEKLSWCDDKLLAAYFSFKKRERLSTYHVSDPQFNSLKEWEKGGGVTTFPVLRHTHHGGKEGCNAFRQDNIDDNGDVLWKFIDNGY